MFAVLSLVDVNALTAQSCRDPVQLCRRNKEFNEQWCKNPLFWFNLCRQLRWSVNLEGVPPVAFNGGVARPYIYTGKVRRRLPAAGGQRFSRDTEPLVDNSAAVEEYYDKQLKKLQNQIQEAETTGNQALMDNILAIQRRNYGIACAGIDERTKTAQELNVSLLTRKPIGPTWRALPRIYLSGDPPQQPDEPVPWPAWAREMLRYREAANARPVAGLLYSGTIDPVSLYAHGYGQCYSDWQRQNTNLVIQLVYEGNWADGDFEGQGRLHRITASSFNQARNTLYYEGQFKAGRKHGQGIVYDLIVDDPVAPPPGAPDPQLKIVYEGGFVNDYKHGVGKQYYTDDAQTELRGVLRYDGQWKGGVRAGQGKEYHVSDDPDLEPNLAYEGQFVGGRYSGQGRKFRRHVAAAGRPGPGPNWAWGPSQHLRCRLRGWEQYKLSSIKLHSCL